jgi:putative Mg2+ transporter-C (MgtC) family protein
VVHGGDWGARRLRVLREAAIGVAAVLVACVVLRPIVQRINRQPLEGTEVVTSYEVEAVCRRDVEERIRTTMISAIRGAAMSLVAVYSEDIPAPERVELTADVSVAGRPVCAARKDR